MKCILFGLIVTVGSVGVASAQASKRPLSLDDLGRLKEVRDPQCAPDGKSVAFVVSQIDVKEDKPGTSHIWTVGLDGQNERQITSSTESESSPLLATTIRPASEVIGGGSWAQDWSG